MRCWVLGALASRFRSSGSGVFGVIGCQGLILRTSHGFADRTTGQMRSTSFSWTAHLSSCWHGTIPDFHRRKHMCRDWRCILPSQPRTALQTPSRPLKRLLCTNAVTLHHPCSTPLANLEESRPLQRADNLSQCSTYAVRHTQLKAILCTQRSCLKMLLAKRTLEPLASFPFDFPFPFRQRIQR